MKDVIEDLRINAALHPLDVDARVMIRAANAVESQAATIALYETTAENYELLQTKVDEQALEIKRLKESAGNWGKWCAQAVKELAALKAKPSGVVLPERASDANVDQLLEVLGWKADDDARADAIKVFNHALDEVARLNSSPVSAALKAPAPGECVAVPDSKDNKINGFKDPVLYFADINDPDETGTDEPDFCDVVLAEDYDRNINALLALIPNLYREPRK